MAYPTYPYPGYQPYYSQPVPDQLAQLRQNQMQQQMMQGASAPPQPIQTQMQYQQPMFAPQAFPYSCEVIWISSEKEAEDYIVAKNSAVALWDRKNSVLYLKETDASGQPHMDAYDLSKRGEEKAAAAPVPQIDLSGYVTWDKLEEYMSERLKKPAKPTRTKEDTDNA